MALVGFPVFSADEAGLFVILSGSTTGYIIGLVIVSFMISARSTGNEKLS